MKVSSALLLVAAGLVAAMVAGSGCGWERKGGLTAAEMLRLLSTGLQDSQSIRDGGGGKAKREGTARTDPRSRFLRLHGVRSADSPSQSGHGRVAGSRSGDVFYDDFLRLWVLDVEEQTETTYVYGRRFFEDEAQTIDAGHDLNINSAEPTAWPLSGSSCYRVTSCCVPTHLWVASTAVR